MVELGRKNCRRLRTSGPERTFLAGPQEVNGARGRANRSKLRRRRTLGKGAICLNWTTPRADKWGSCVACCHEISPPLPLSLAGMPSNRPDPPRPSAEFPHLGSRVLRLPPSVAGCGDSPRVNIALLPYAPAADSRSTLSVDCKFPEISWHPGPTLRSPPSDPTPCRFRFPPFTSSSSPLPPQLSRWTRARTCCGTDRSSKPRRSQRRCWCLSLPFLSQQGCDPAGLATEASSPAPRQPAAAVLRPPQRGFAAVIRFA